MDDILVFLRNLFQLVVAPARGWEDLEAERDGMTERAEEELASFNYLHCFLPTIAVCSLSWFIRLIYGYSGGLLGCVQGSVVMFVSLFLGAQVSMWLMGFAMPRLMEEDPRLPSDAKWNRGRMMDMICYSITFIGLVLMLTNVIKVRIALLEFLPFYVVFIIWKGWHYVGIREQNIGLFMISACLSVLGSVYIISFLLNAVM